jgi:integrase
MRTACPFDAVVRDGGPFGDVSAIGLDAFSFGDYLVIWFNIHKENVALNTVASLKGQVFHIIGPWFNAQKVTLRGIQPEDIEAFYREKQADGVSNNTLRHYHGTIRSALQCAFKRGYFISNVADRVDKPKKEIFKGSFYNEDELKKLFTVAKGTNLELAIHMAAYYGLRREEVCGLKWDAIDFQIKPSRLSTSFLKQS